MKILAVTAGRKNGNSEWIAKAALEVCEKEFGAEVVWCNLHNHKINPCIGCESCIIGMYKNLKRPVCIHDGKDDLKKIMNEWEEADGIIIVVPSYFQQEPGIFKTFTDRWLCYEWGNMLNIGIIDEIPKKIVGIISVGGSAQFWQNMTCDQIHAQLTCQSVKVVDKYAFTRCATSGHVLVEDEKMKRVQQVGRNVALSCLTDYNQVKFLATDWKSFCPTCNANLICKGYPHWDGLSFEYECAVCGTGGDLVANDSGDVIFKVAENGLEHCRAISEGRKNHLKEIQTAHKAAAEAMSEINKQRKIASEYKIREI